VVRQVRKCVLELQVNSLSDEKRFGYPGGNGHGTWANETTNRAVPDWSGGHSIESINIEILADRGIAQVPIAQTIGALKGATVYEFEITRIVAGTRDRGQVWACLPETHCADRPTTEERLWN
jgi:hypothetical protein